MVDTARAFCWRGRGCESSSCNCVDSAMGSDSRAYSTSWKNIVYYSWLHTRVSDIFISQKYLDNSSRPAFCSIMGMHGDSSCFNDICSHTTGCHVLRRVWNSITSLCVASKASFSKMAHPRRLHYRTCRSIAQKHAGARAYGYPTSHYAIEKLECTVKKYGVCWNRIFGSARLVSHLRI